MAYVIQFARLNSIHQEIADCPLQSNPPSTDLSACASCPFNAVAPKEERIGCIIKIPAYIYNSALDKIAHQQPSLHRKFLQLLQEESKAQQIELSERANKWLDLGSVWFAHASNSSDSDGLELSSLIVRFAQTMLEQQQDVCFMH